MEGLWEKAMTDIKSVEARSRNMAAIRGKNTRPEAYLRKLLFAKGFRYRMNSATIPGRPDIWLRKYNTAIYVNGCFWHRHEGCKFSYIPKSNEDFWRLKFENNVSRDAKVKNQLRVRGIKCFIIWECSIKRMIKQEDYRNKCVCLIKEFIMSNALYGEI